MRVRIAASTKQPVLNSVYLSGFNEETLEFLKSQRPFACYHRNLQEYEVTPEVATKIRVDGPEVLDQRKVHPTFVRTAKGKYGYQEDAVMFAKKTDSIFLNFGQGMGKSLTTMRIIEARRLRKVLIICGQGNLQEEWIKDARKHNYCDLLTMRIVGEDTGASRKKKIEWLTRTREDAGVDLINIEALRSQEIVDAISCAAYDCLVVDEVQSAKGWKANQTEGLHSIDRTEGQVRIALSGTPVLNSPLEFFSLLKFLGMLKDTARTTFEKYYGIWGFDFWGHYQCTGYKNLKDLAELLKPVLCYVSKDELGLPEKRRKKVELRWNVPVRYSELKRAYKLPTARLKRAGFKTKPQVRAEMLLISSTAEEKLEFVYAQSLLGRLLVFSQYTTALVKYQQHLASKGVKVLLYTGDMSMSERLEVLERWRNGEADVLLLSIMAARYGLNLTEAQTTIFIEPPANMSVLEQAEDRAHRIGQSLPVTSHLLVCSELDDAALENIVTKQVALEELENIWKNG